MTAASVRYVHAAEKENARNVQVCGQCSSIGRTQLMGVATITLL